MQKHKRLVKHPSGFFIDLVVLNALPNADEYHKKCPSVGDPVIFKKDGLWYQGWCSHESGNSLIEGCNTKSFCPATIFSYGFCVGFDGVGIKIMNSTTIPIVALKSPARLALEQYRRRLDGLLI